MARVFSGVQPTADVPHLGNYIGAFRQWVGLQEDHEAFYCVVDLHTLTVDWEPKTLSLRTLQTAASLIASGIDPQRSVLFVQSEVPQHTELAWIFTCLSKLGELSRMTQFKDKGRGADSASVGTGLLTYPVLMAADVLAYRGELVPIGDDQRQHLELMRDLAERFNRKFGETFPVPQAVVAKQGARIMSLDDPSQKMAKSAGREANLIWMNESPDSVRKKIARAVTDSGSEIRAGVDKPAISNLLEIYACVTDTTVSQVEALFEGKGYGEFKSSLSDVLIEFLGPFQQRFEELMGDQAELQETLDKGAAEARDVAEQTMESVRERIGLRNPRSRRAP